MDAKRVGVDERIDSFVGRPLTRRCEDLVAGTPGDELGMVVWRVGRVNPWGDRRGTSPARPPDVGVLLLIGAERLKKMPKSSD
jgi:hypothetical protein